MSNSWALVTGASSGLGVAYARRLASEGVGVVLAARSEDKLQAVADELRALGVEARVVPTDLTDRESRSRLIDACRDLPLSHLINNAGFATMGDFLDAEPGRISREMELNMVALTELTRALAPGMVERGRGAIVNVASTAAFQPIPTMAVYAATKSYVLSFSQALWAEVKAQGVKVVAICPGPTETSFFANAGEDSAMTRRRTPEQVVASTFRALEQGRPSVVDGRFNAVQATVAKLSPARISLPIAKLAVRPTRKA